MSIRSKPPVNLRSRRRATSIRQVVKHAALFIGAAVMLAPVYVTIITSLSPAAEVFSWPPKAFPSSPRWENYSDVLDRLNFDRYFLNTLLVASVSTASVVLLCSMAGFAFAKLVFRGRNILFGLVLVTVMIPMQVTIVPLYTLMRSAPFFGGNDIYGSGGFGLLNSFGGLIIPSLATTFGVFLMRQTFAAMPSDMLEAAQLDGCSKLGAFFRIYLPLAGPSLGAVAILNFTEVWNAFLWPLIVAPGEEMRTLPVGLSAMKGQSFDDWHLLMAGTVLTALPPVVLFLIAQRYFVRGITMTGSKG